jgi:hypothetical protein
MNRIEVGLISLLIAIIVVVIALVIYDNYLGPSNTKDNLNKVNKYLNELISGYKEASPAT